MKICKTCLIEQDDSMFYKNRNSTLNNCKKCCYEKELEYYKNPENRLKKRKSTIKRKYNLDFNQYELMMIAQGSSCKICDKILSENGSKDVKPHVDHCHTTGSVRGILCSYCNTMLGVFKDNPEYFQRAIDYLKGTNEKET